MSIRVRPPPRSPWLLALLGAWVGVLVTLSAWVLAVELTDRGWTLASILYAHRENPLFWFVDLTPLWLGWIGWLLGLNERLAARVQALHDRMLDEPTRERPAPFRVEEPTAQLGDRPEESTIDRPPLTPISLAHFAHELRTPLNAVIGYSELVSEELSDGGHTALAEDADKVVAAGRHLLSLVDDVLDLSRLDAHRLPVQLQAIPVRGLADEVLDTLAPLAQQHNDVLLRDLPTDTLEVRGDSVRIRQILLNLVGNACKFTQDGTVSLRVLAGPDGFVTFAVRDTGVGMTAAEMARLFREYGQANDEIHARFGGSGLGLLISQRLAVLMSGWIEVVSTPGEGSTFSLILPRASGGRAPLVSTALTLEQRAFAVPKGSEAVALLVHPSSEKRDLLRRTLGRAGFRIEVASDGSTGLARAREHAPSLAVVSAELPDLSGPELVRALQERRGGGRMPIVVLGHLVGEAAERVAETLTPPVDLRRLERLAQRYRRVNGVRSVLLVQRATPRRASLADALGRDGLDVEVVEDGGGAVAAWRGEPVDVVVIELRLEGDDRVLERLAADPRWRAVPVLVFAANTLIGWDLARIDQQVDRFVVCGSEQWEDVIDAVRDGVGDLLAAPRA